MTVRPSSDRGEGLYVLVMKGGVDPYDALRTAAWLRSRLDGTLIRPE